MEKTDYKITEFHNSEFGSIRMIEDGGRLLFSGIDVAFALGYAKPRNAINVHCKGALKRGVLTSGGVQPMIFIPEGDVYRLITKSRLKSAQNFEKWVFDEVLPAIRKTGGYLETDLLDRVKDNPELLLEFAERLLAENNRNRELQNRVKDMQPKADYYDHFMIIGECTNIRTTAKEIEFPERKFVKLLLNRGFLYRSPSGTLLPYAVEKNNDLFIVKDYTCITVRCTAGRSDLLYRNLRCRRTSNAYWNLCGQWSDDPLWASGSVHVHQLSILAEPFLWIRAMVRKRAV